MLVAKTKQKKMTLQTALLLIQDEYEKACKLDFVRNPLAYALYNVWQLADGQEDN